MNRYSSIFHKYKQKNDMLPKNILDEVLQIKRFNNPKVIEADKFSYTIAFEKETGEKMAVKITADNNLSSNEKLWQNFRNHHVLPLKSYEFLENPKVHLFYTIVPSYTLKDLITKKEFKNNQDAIRKMTKWFKEAAAGVQYLHQSGYNHMNISTKNIVITEDGSAKIKDFQYLKHNDKHLTRYGIKKYACPPETYNLVEGNAIIIHGQKFDSYSFGMMILEAMTGSYLKKKLSGSVKSWSKDVYPVLYKALSEKKFKKLVSKQYPKATRVTDLSDLRILIASTLCFNIEDRPTMRQLFITLLELTFYNKFLLLKPAVDVIWKDKVTPQQLQLKIDTIVLQKKDPYSRQKTKIQSSCKSDGSILIDERNSALKIHQGHPRSPITLNRKPKKDIFVQINDKTKDVKSTVGIPHEFCLGDLKEMKKDLLSEVRKLYSTEGMTGDSDGKSTVQVVLNAKHKVASSSESDSRKDPTVDSSTKENAACIIEKDDEEITTDRSQEKPKSIFTVMGFLRTACRWAFDEYLYRGITHNDSYINILSEALTG